MVPRIWKLISNKALRLAPATVLMTVAILAILVVAGLAVVVDWPQYQRDSHHIGALKVANNSIAPILPANLIWSLQTGGAVRSTTAYVPQEGMTTLELAGISASIAAGDTILTVNDPAPDLNIGDPLFIGDPMLLNSGEYLGPILAITRSATQAVVTVRNAPENAYTLQPLHVSLYRQDQLKTAFNHLPVADADTLTVKNPERFLVGDLIMVLDDDPVNNEIGTIKSITGAMITLDSTLQKDHPLNAVITAGLPAAPITGGMLYVGSDDNYLYAVNPLNGNVCWKSNADYRLGAVRGAPLIDSARGRVYAVSNSGRIFAFSFSGEMLWSYPDVNIPALGQIDSAAVLDGDGNIYFAANEGAKDINGKVTPATIYSLSPAGTLNNSQLLPTDYQPGGVAIYQLDDADAATFRVLLSTSFTHTAFSTAAAVATSDTIVLDNVGPDTGRYYTAGDVVKVVAANAGSGSYFTVAEVQTGAIRLTQQLGIDLPINSQVTISKGTLYSLHADLAAATMLTYPTGAAQAAPIVGADGMIYLGDTSADVVQQKTIGLLHAIHEENNVLVVKDGWLPPHTAAPILHPAVVNTTGTRVIVGDSPATGAGTLYVYAADGPPADPREFPALLHSMTLDGALSGPLTFDDNGKVLANSKKGTAYCFDTEANLFVELWHWNSKTDGGMPAAFPLRTAATLAGSLVLLGSDDGRVYALGTDVPMAPGGKEQLLPLPSAKWPFYHRDGRRQGSVMNDLLTFEPGAFQPTLRWFNSHAQPLYSSPVVSSNTPDGQARVYVASEDGRIYGYNAANGTPLSAGGWSHLVGVQLQSGWLDLPNSGPIRATPAVDANGNIAVGSVDGHFYLHNSNGSLLADSWTVGAEEKSLFGDFSPSPVIGKDGTIYAVTSNSIDTNGLYSGVGMLGTTATLNDGVPENGYVTLTQPGKLIYSVTDTARTLAISRIRIYTRDQGTLHIYKLASDDGSTEDKLPIYSQAFKASATASYHDIDITIEAQKIEWVNESAEGQIAAFEIFTTGSLLAVDLSGKFYDASLPAPQPALNPAAPTVVAPYLNIDSVEARFASPTWIKSVAITTANAYKIYLIDANGVTHNDWASIAAKTSSATDTISIERLVTAIGWTKTDAAAARLEGFSALRRDLSNCSHIYAFQADGSIKWSYPPAGEELAPIVASPMVVYSGADDIIYVVTSGGTALAVKYDEIALTPEVLWKKELFTPVVASPIAVDSWPGGPDEDVVMQHFIAIVDTLGAVHLIQLDGTTQRDEWQVSAPCSNALAVTAQGSAYLITDLGDIYRLEFDPIAAQKVTLLRSLQSSVYSSPVIDSTGRVYFGTDSGSLYCLDAGAETVNWIYTPQRGTISATLTGAVNSDASLPFAMQVSQTAGLRVGDPLWISHADGSAMESLGLIVSLTPPANPTSKLRSPGPDFDALGQLRSFALLDDLSASIAIGDTVHDAICHSWSTGGYRGENCAYQSQSDN